MAKNLNPYRKYFSLRGAGLEPGEYYTTVKNQTFQQNSYFTYSKPECLFSTYSDGATGILSFNSKFYLLDGTGTFTLWAGAEDYTSGTWYISINGSTEITRESGNGFVEIRYTDAGFNLSSGYNTMTGSFEPDSSSSFSISVFWKNGWSA